MTAEERLAYFQGQRRRGVVEPRKVHENNYEKQFFKVRCLLAIFLFIGFLSLDYTGYQVKGIGSEEIVREVTKNLEVNLANKMFL